MTQSLWCVVCRKARSLSCAVFWAAASFFAERALPVFQNPPSDGGLDAQKRRPLRYDLLLGACPEVFPEQKSIIRELGLEFRGNGSMPRRMILRIEPRCPVSWDTSVVVYVVFSDFSRCWRSPYSGSCCAALHSQHLRISGRLRRMLKMVTALRRRSRPSGHRDPHGRR